MIKYGEFLGKVEINGIGLKVFSNGDCHHVGEEIQLDYDGNFLGLSHQCVALVRRYLFQKTGKNTADIFHADAKDWFANREKLNLEEVDIYGVKTGDILTFTGGTWGHIALIINVEPNCFYIAQQNFYNNHKDLGLQISISSLLNGEMFESAAGEQFQFQAVLRCRDYVY